MIRAFLRRLVRSEVDVDVVPAAVYTAIAQAYNAAPHDQLRGDLVALVNDYLALERMWRASR